jgi:hypothetical protein
MQASKEADAGSHPTDAANENSKTKEPEKLENFQDCFADDLDAFFDMDDFASVHTIDGVKCTVVLAEMHRADAKTSYGLMKSTLNPKETAINKTTHRLYIRKSDLKRKVTVNSLMTLDGKKYFVQNVERVQGMCKIELGIHEV